MTGAGLALAVLLGVQPVPAPSGESIVLADLDPGQVRLADGETPDPRSILAAFVEADAAYRFDVGRVVAWTDARWYGTVSGSGEGSPPLLEIRRWPGDTVAAFYALSPGPGGSEIDGATLGPARAGPSGWALRELLLERDREAYRALWAERSAGEGLGRCAAVLLPGDAGLGERSRAAREAELLAVLERVELPAEAWRLAGAPTSGTPALPMLPRPTRSWDEGRDPWQTIEGPGFTLGLPPGILARRLDTGVTVPSAVPGAALWFRGSLTDRDGVSVAVGDGARAGYVTEVTGDRGSWIEGSRPPAGSPAAARKDRLSLDRIVLEGAGARAGWVSSWSEPGFAGDWIVFRLDFGAKGVEIGIPVVEGRRSLALFWIPVTWRDASRPPAPPPIDPASRFGIRFDRTTRLQRTRRGPIEGTLLVPGLRVELPEGWWPSAALRSGDGFPVLLVDPRGNVAGRLERLGRGTIEGTRSEGNWSERPGARSRGARAWFEGPGGAILFEAPEGHAWRLVPLTDDIAGWSRMVDSVVVTRAPVEK